VRHLHIGSYAPIFFNKNAGNPNAWTYEADTSREPAFNDSLFRGGNARLTWQASQKHKLAVSYDYQNQCNCPRSLTAQIAPEANVINHAMLEPKDSWFVDWTAPLTNRLLVEGRAYRQREHAYRPYDNLYFTHDPGAVKLNGVFEQSTGMSYRGGVGDSRDTWLYTGVYRATMSYITGAHSLKAGFNLGFNRLDQLIFSTDSPMSFQFNNGVPNRLTLRANPWGREAESDDHGAFVQDRWTVDRLTVTAGVRYDYFYVSFPAVTVGPAQYVPNRNLSLPAGEGVRWHDLQPRTGLAYDLFGNGKTALRVSMNKYLPFYGLQLNVGTEAGTFSTNMAPAARLVVAANRAWNDANRNFVPDCDLINPVANGECGAMAPSNFGSTASGVAYDPDIIQGWNKRAYDWQFSTGVQHELMRQVSVDVGYFRTWYGNQFVTDNRAWAAADFDAFNITAPADPRCRAAAAIRSPDLQRQAGEVQRRPTTHHVLKELRQGNPAVGWPRRDLQRAPAPRTSFQGARAPDARRWTTATSWMTCLNLPGQLAGSSCHRQTEFLTDFKLLARTVHSDRRAGGHDAGVPGPEIAANFVATNAVVEPSLDGGCRATCHDRQHRQPGTMACDR
jgi:hypothetical protein